LGTYSPELFPSHPFTVIITDGSHSDIIFYSIGS
jgi:hypothetical protein